MLHDVNDLAVSLHTPAACTEWNAVQHGFLAHAAVTPTHLARVLEAAPDFALAHAAKGLFLVILGRSELLPVARHALELAAGGEANAREAQYVAALRAAVEGRLRLAADMFDQLLEIWPTDALAMKLVQALRFMCGDPGGMRRSVEAVAPQWEDHPMRGYLLGCHSFALEETGEYGAAERAGRAGLELAPDDAWGLHAVAHVHDMTGRADDGLKWLAGREAHWAHCNNFGYHVWWHLALFHLDRTEYDRALALYDTRVRAERTDDFRDIANAASMLLRLEFEGVDVGHRWEEVAELAAARVEDGALVFADLHYLSALIRTGRMAEADRIAQRLAEETGQIRHDQHEVAQLTGADLARGLVLFRDADYKAALAALRAGLAGQQRLGGSHAQRDVFQRLTIEAAFRADDMDAAETLLRQRALARGGEDGYMQRCMARVALRRQDRRAAGLAAQ
ncbi:MAG: tetratricopeptide repeat protein [Alphaproteobacteria bacterium]|nr:MAG: tetratricopeptide repeat protein [Alphaproteobacteria bacterium]